MTEAVLDFVRDAPMVPRSRILERFRCDGELEVSAILHDLLDSGLVFASGTGAQSVYRAASDQELMQLSKIYAGQGIDDLVWVTVFRSGPIAESELATLLGRPLPELREVCRRWSRPSANAWAMNAKRAIGSAAARLPSTCGKVTRLKPRSKDNLRNFDASSAS